MHLTPKIALVTGASHGIGTEIVRQLARAGMTVLLSARNVQQGQATTQHLVDEGLDVRFKALDVTNQNMVDALAAEIAQEYGVLDILINNAAGMFDYDQTVLQEDVEQVRAIFDTNLFGAWRMAQAFVPLLRKSSAGRLVNVGSGAGTYGAPEGLLANCSPNLPGYSLAKLALAGLTIKLAAELADTPIIVNAVCPGTTASYPWMTDIPGARPVEQGAASVVWAALLPDDGPRGGFFRDGQLLPW